MLYLAQFSRYKHFCVLQKIRKFKMAAKNLARQFFFLNFDGYSAETPCESKIWSKSPYFAQFSRYKHFCENSKWPQFLVRQNFFFNWNGYSAEIPTRSLYLARFPRYKYFCVLQFLRKIRKFKIAAIFGEI